MLSKSLLIFDEVSRSPMNFLAGASHSPALNRFPIVYQQRRGDLHLEALHPRVWFVKI